MEDSTVSHIGVGEDLSRKVSNVFAAEDFKTRVCPDTRRDEDSLSGKVSHENLMTARSAQGSIWMSLPCL
ncbi:hypothetical protein J6590_009164 [Homalodisca vitripennis]|nr:hypothetical protein J6590_009164 [Homalodisca vitripennis]